MMSKVLPCSCAHDGQDRIHGKGMRVYNPLAKSEKQQQQYRCTICLHVKADSSR